MERIRIVIADDHPKVRAQIGARLGRELDIEIVGQADCSAQALDFTLEKQPHIVLMDPMMRDGKGLDVLRKIVAQIPATEVVVLTAFVDTALQMELQRAGVCRILPKGVNSSELVNVLREVASDAPKNKLSI